MATERYGEEYQDSLFDYSNDSYHAICIPIDSDSCYFNKQFIWIHITKYVPIFEKLRPFFICFTCLAPP